MTKNLLKHPGSSLTLKNVLKMPKKTPPKTFWFFFTELRNVLKITKKTSLNILGLICRIETKSRRLSSFKEYPVYEEIRYFLLKNGESNLILNLKSDLPYLCTSGFLVNIQPCFFRLEKLKVGFEEEWWVILKVKIFCLLYDGMLSMCTKACIQCLKYPPLAIFEK